MFIPRDLISGLVLSGGRGQRMGGADKGLQPFKGAPMAMHTIMRLEPQVDMVRVNANRNLAAYESMGVVVIPDVIGDFAGPLAGFQAGLETCEHPYLITVPCDSPRFPMDLVEKLSQALIIQDLEEAKTELRNMLVHAKFGDASSKVVIEEFLDGIELSCFVLTDGKNYKILPTAKDYKRIGEGDTGLNTGGMGAVSPVPFADSVLLEKIETRIVKPTIDGLQKDGIEYKGFVFIGLINVKGEPMVIEYNVRMGDPETEVVMPRIKSDLMALFVAVANQKLDEVEIEIDPRSATTIMIVSGGYPEDYEKGHEIFGLENVTDSIVFHAGTKLENDKVVTNGGRVLAITSYGNDFQEAIKKSYQNIDKLHFDKMYFRKDIGFDLF